MVISLNSSLSLTLDNFFRRQQYDTMLEFNNNQKASRVIDFAEAIEGVEATEIRFVQAASMFISGQLVKDRHRFIHPWNSFGWRFLYPADGERPLVYTR